MKIKTKLLSLIPLLGVFLGISTALQAQTGDALVLDGGQYMKVATKASLNATASTSLTITMRFKTSANAGSPRLFAKRAGASTSVGGTTGVGYEAFLGNSAGWKVGPNVTSTAGGGRGGSFNTLTPINDGNWHYVAMILDNSVTNAYKTTLVVDGTTTASSTQSSNQDIANLVEFVIGAASDYTNKLTGTIDDVRIYGKALDATEITSDKNTSTVNNTTPNLVAAWDFENINSNTVNDISDNGNTGTLVGYKMQYASTVLSQNNTSNVNLGSINQEIIGINVKTTNPRNYDAINLTALKFTLSGTSDIADISNVKVYSTGASAIFSTSSQFGNNITPAAGTLTANGNVPLNTGDNYFWIAYDISSSASALNKLDASCEGFTIDGQTITLASPNNITTGDRTIVDPAAPQVVFDILPQDKQFFARKADNKAEVKIKGRIMSPNIASVKVDFYRGNTLRNTLSQNLVYQNGAANFELSDKITAELAQYKIVVSSTDNSNHTVLLAKRENLLAGDAYLIMGQSNSHPTRAGYTFQNEFLRSFGIQTANTNYAVYNPADTTWGAAQANYTGASGTADAANPTYFAGPQMVGVWGLQMMEDLKNKLNIPICIINGGAGSSNIEQNLPGSNHYDLTNIYGSTMYRIKQSGLQNDIKAIFWHQGEKNADGTFAQYPANFDILYNAWKQDLPGVQRVYVFQTDQNGCYGGASVNQATMREWQRTLPVTKSDIVVYPMAGTPGKGAGDGNEIVNCHYGLSGYLTLGNRVAFVVAKDLYGINEATNVLPPNIINATFNPARTEITLTFDNANLVAQADIGSKSLKDYFYLGGQFGDVSNLQVNGNKVILTLSSASTARTISYLSNSLYNDNSGVYAGPYLTNSVGIGALTFHEFGIDGALAAPSPTPSGKVLELVNGGGSNQYMSVDDNADINIGAGQSRTITVLVKSNSPQSIRILSKRNTIGYEFITSGSGVAGINAYDGAGRAAAFTSTPYIMDGRWHHFAMVVDQANNSSKTVKMYIDGVFISGGSAFSGGGDFSNTVKLIVGGISSVSSPSGQFNGQLDNVRIWNKAMTVSELEADMEAVVNAPTTDLLAAWDFENITGVTVPDVSGNNHPGTLVGNPATPTVQVNMIYSAASVIQSNIPVGRGDNNNRIIAVKVSTDGYKNPLTLTDLNFTLNGTTNINDISKIKVYYTGNSKRFAMNTLFATDITPTSGVLTASGSKALLVGDNYFWITYDVKANAAEGNLLDATCESVVINNVAQTLATPNPTGASSILLTHKLLFKPGDAGAYTYRIPAIVTAKDGSLVTAIDKRVSRNNDLPSDVDILVRRSTDNGQTWSPALTIADLGNTNNDGASDPAMIVEQTTGKIICLFATNNGLMYSISNNLIRIRMCTSMDNGITWTAPQDITDQIYGPGCSNPITKNWQAAWVASGRMNQTRSGRIMAVVGVRQTGAGQIDNFMIYSDDAGVTWQTSTARAEAGGDEAKVVELDNGNLLMSIRNGGTRRYNTSTDQGMTWGTPYNNSQVLDPNCNGDLIRYTSTLDGYNKSRLIQTVPYVSSAPRRNISVLISYDEGQTWPERKTIYLGDGDYSSITMLPDGTLGMYYENQDDQIYNMYFARFTLDWLTDGRDTYVPSSLPLNLIDFGANYNKASKQIKTNWKTQSEVNVNRFEVEFALDAINFTKAGTLNAKGNNLNGLHNYSFNFQAQQSGLVYIRLKMIDNDGTFKYSKVVTVKTEGIESFLISPNPVKDKLTVYTGLNNKTASIQIINASGSLVKQLKSKESNFIIDLSNLTKGTYLIRMTVDNQVSTQKFVKE